MNDHDPSGEVTAPPVGTLEAARTRAVAVLSAHFVHDHIGIDDLEHRIGRAVEARSQAELDALIGDLPALPPKEAAQLGIYRAQRVATVPERRRVMSVFGDFKRSGAWTVPERLMILTAIGDVKLDFREARFGPGAVQLAVHQGLGDLNLIIPPGVRVEVDVVQVIGDRHETADDPARPAEPDEVLIRVTGSQILGDIKVRTLLPGEPEKPSKRKRGRGG